MSTFRKLRDRFALSALACAVLGAFVIPAAAEDIDIFNNPPNGGLPPNVLLMIDNGANWSSSYTVDGVESKQEAVSDAIYEVASSQALVGKFNIGLMTFTKSNNPEGGKIISAVKSFTEAAQADLKCLVYKEVKDGACYKVEGSNNKVSNFALESSNNSPVAKSFNEAYLYFKGDSPLSGKADDSNEKAVSSDSGAYDGGKYKSPLVGNFCAGNFIILIATTTGNIAAGEDNGAKSLLREHIKREPQVLPLSHTNFAHNWGDEFAGFLSSVDLEPSLGGLQSINTYVIDVFDPDAKADPDARAYFKSVAAQGNGRYFEAKDAGGIAGALGEILEEVQAVNSSFASASMPISMNVESEGTNENEVYVGMFRPSVEPRWMGNLKKYSYAWDASLKKPYMIGADASNPLKADPDAKPVYDPVTGFINEKARSYWTKGSSYWTGVPGYEDFSASDSPDGPVVEKGATAQMLRERSLAREILTRCDGATNCSSGFRPIAAADFGNDENLLSWFKGADVKNETGRRDTESGVKRPSIHGDVLHSRPAVVNYGRDAGVVAFYGANDGLFRAVRGSDGKELWAVTFPEQLHRVKALYDNLAKVEDPNDPLVKESIKHPYFADGSPSVYTTISGDLGEDKIVETALLYIPMRRGGEYIYALDISSPSANPKFKWMIKGGVKDDKFEELGQTWSTPKPARVAGYPGKRVLLFGAGYDAAAEDYVPGAAGGRPSRTAGRGIYMVDADTGQHLWTGTHADMFSIPGDLTLVNYDRDANNYVDRAYFADTGGNVWRANFGVDDAGKFTGSITKIASLGGSCSATSDADCRKFLYHPSVVVETDGSVSILIGSGDREHPHSDTVQNRFYMIKDSGATAGVSDDQLQQLTASTTTVDADKIKNGWYFDLREGEKLTGNALSLDGKTYFNTNTPPVQDANSCVSSLGTARQYMFSYKNPFAVITYLKDVGGTVMAGGGFPPPPVPMTLKFGDDYWTGVGGMKPTDMGVTQPGARQKTFWSKDIDE